MPGNTKKSNNTHDIKKALLNTDAVGKKKNYTKKPNIRERSFYTKNLVKIAPYISMPPTSRPSANETPHSIPDVFLTEEDVNQITGSSNESHYSNSTGSMYNSIAPMANAPGQLILGYINLCYPVWLINHQITTENNRAGQIRQPMANSYRQSLWNEISPPPVSANPAANHQVTHHQVRK